MRYRMSYSKNWSTQPVTTEFGSTFGFGDIQTYEQFRTRIPIHTYEQMFPYIERLMRGEQNILWPTETKWFSKSSGTTNAKSKFIPVTQEALEDCHFKGARICCLST